MNFLSVVWQSRNPVLSRIILQAMVSNSNSVSFRLPNFSGELTTQAVCHASFTWTLLTLQQSRPNMQELQKLSLEVTIGPTMSNSVTLSKFFLNNDAFLPLDPCSLAFFAHSRSPPIQLFILFSLLTSKYSLSRSSSCSFYYYCGWWLPC